MIIVIGGRAGAGKSTVAKLVAKRFGFKHYSVGDLQRQMAKEKGISLAELSKLEEKDPKIDLELDNRQKKLALEEDKFVIDGRLSAFFMPEADFKFFLDGDERVRALRIFSDKREEEKPVSVEEMLRAMRQREESERKRFLEYYNCNPYDKSLYDEIINTTSISPEEVVGKIYKAIKKSLENKAYNKGEKRN